MQQQIVAEENIDKHRQKGLQERATSAMEHLTAEMQNVSLKDSEKERVKSIFSKALSQIVENAEVKLENSSESDASCSMSVENHTKANDKHNKRRTKPKCSNMKRKNFRKVQK